MNDDTKQDAGEAPAQTDANGPDVAAYEAAEVAAEEYAAKIKALYVAFVKDAVDINATNTIVAKAAILMLSDSLANMAGASRLPQETFNGAVCDMMEHLEQTAMNLSHELGAYVFNILNPPETVASLADADMTVEN